MLESLDEAADNMKDFKKWDNALRAAYPENVLAWEREVEAYRVNKMKRCPYMLSNDSTL